MSILKGESINEKLHNREIELRQEGIKEGIKEGKQEGIQEEDGTQNLTNFYF